MLGFKIKAIRAVVDATRLRWDTLQALVALGRSIDLPEKKFACRQTLRDNDIQWAIEIDIQERSLVRTGNWPSAPANP